MFFFPATWTTCHHIICIFCANLIGDIKLCIKIMSRVPITHYVTSANNAGHSDLQCNPPKEFEYLSVLSMYHTPEELYLFVWMSTQQVGNVCLLCIRGLSPIVPICLIEVLTTIWGRFDLFAWCTRAYWYKTPNTTSTSKILVLTSAQLQCVTLCYVWDMHTLLSRTWTQPHRKIKKNFKKNKVILFFISIH